MLVIAHRKVPKHHGIMQGEDQEGRPIHLICLIRGRCYVKDGKRLKGPHVHGGGPNLPVVWGPGGPNRMGAPKFYDTGNRRAAHNNDYDMTPTQTAP